MCPQTPSITHPDTPPYPFLGLGSIHGLINQMMDLRKIDKGQMQMRMSEIDLISFVQDIYQMFACGFNNAATFSTVFKRLFPPKYNKNSLPASSFVMQASLFLVSSFRFQVTSVTLGVPPGPRPLFEREGSGVSL